MILKTILIILATLVYIIFTSYIQLNNLIEENTYWSIFGLAYALILTSILIYQRKL